MTYDQAKSTALRLANRDGVEYGVRHVAGDVWEYAEASWYAIVHEKMQWSLDDIELVLPEGHDEERTTWPEVLKYWDNYDGAPQGESA